MNHRRSKPARAAAAGLLLLVALLVGCGEDTGISDSDPVDGPGRIWRVPEDRPTIGDALAAASGNDTVLVACGLYEESGLILKSRVVLMSADLDPACTIIDARGEGGVLRCFSGDSLTQVVGFTIRGGRSTLGGGLWLDHSSPVIERCIFEADTSTGLVSGGGAVYAYRSEARFLNCEFRNNRSERVGGAITFEASAPRFTGCRFTTNTAPRGGAAAFLSNSRPLLTACAFDSNRAGGSAPEGDGGAVLAVDGEVTLHDCGFSGNISDGAGGGGFRGYAIEGQFTECRFEANTTTSVGGAILLDAQSSVGFADCTFEGNEAEDGGGLAIRGASETLLLRSHFARNEAGNHGGGVWALDSTLEADSCGFALNRGARGAAASVAGTRDASFTGCVFDGNLSVSWGGGVWCEGPDVVVEESTFHGNAAGLGGGVFVGVGSSLDMSRSIIAFTTEGGPVACASGGATLSCCDLFGSDGADWPGCLAGQDTLRNNFSADPLFCDPSIGDFGLAPGSPCLTDSATCGRIGAASEGCSGY